MEVTIWSHFRDETWRGEVPEELLDVTRAEEDSVNEIIFRLFNRVTVADSIRLDEWEYQLPSLSVGDRVTWEGTADSAPRTFEVKGVGWEEVTPEPKIHKATPGGDGHHCTVCGARIKRVPGGQGPTWVHTDSGAVAAPDPPRAD